MSSGRLPKADLSPSKFGASKKPRRCSPAPKGLGPETAATPINKEAASAKNSATDRPVTNKSLKPSPEELARTQTDACDNDGKHCDPNAETDPKMTVPIYKPPMMTMERIKESRFWRDYGSILEAGAKKVKCVQDSAKQKIIEAMRADYRKRVIEKKKTGLYRARKKETDLHKPLNPTKAKPLAETSLETASPGTGGNRKPCFSDAELDKMFEGFDDF